MDNDAFQVPGRDSSSPRHAAPCRCRQRLRDVVAIAHPLLVGVRRRHALSGFVIDEPDQKARHPGLRAEFPLDPILRKQLLNAIPKFV